MAKQKPKQGTILIKPASKDGAIFRYLKTKEWFSPLDYHKLTTRLQLFSKRYHVYVISNDDPVIGDIVMDDSNIGVVVGINNDYMVRVEILKSINASTQMVYDNFNKRFLAKSMASYIEDLDIYVNSNATHIDEKTGKFHLNGHLKFDGCKKKMTTMYNTYRVKVAASSDHEIPAPSLSPKAISDLIGLNGSLKTVSYFIKKKTAHIIGYTSTK